MSGMLLKFVHPSVADRPATADALVRDEPEEDEDDDEEDEEDEEEGEDNGDSDGYSE